MIAAHGGVEYNFSRAPCAGLLQAELRSFWCPDPERCSPENFPVLKNKITILHFCALVLSVNKK
jgi:hypothetical protein